MKDETREILHAGVLALFMYAVVTVFVGIIAAVVYAVVVLT